MLKLTVQMSDDSFDDEKQEFVQGELFVLELEHSLVSLSKWESKFEKPFLGKEAKTDEETLGYIKAMIVTEEYPLDILDHFTTSHMDQVQKYIESKMTATWFNESKKAGPSRETITSELIYFWMTSYQIPWEAEHWHLNRLFTLIKVFNAKNEKPEKQNQSDMVARRRALNEQRKRELGNKG